MANYKLDYTGDQINNAIGEVVDKNFAGTITVGGLETTTPIPITGGGTNSSTQTGALTNILGSSKIPIENGGTNADTAKTALANLGGVSMDLLWENASPTSSFPNQTISLDLSGYTHTMILAVGATTISSRVVPMVITKVGLGGILLLHTIWNTSAMVSRLFRTTSNGYIFDSVSENNYLIPLYIYGINGM